MPQNLTDIIGYCAAFLTTIAFAPQAYQSWKTRNLDGISLTMYSLFTTGVALWFFYGLLIHSMPIIFANTITLFLSSSIMYLKIKQVLKRKHISFTLK
ncbi:MAG: SemiSWEET transporter [Methylophilaceae bacterium]|jgi:MtN3 and saliva related transmembrane protein